MNFIWKFIKALVGLSLCLIAGTLIAIGVLIMVVMVGILAKMVWAELSEMIVMVLCSIVGFAFIFWLFDNGVEWGFNAIKNLFKRSPKVTGGMDI